MPELYVASGGGHIEQLLLLARRSLSKQALESSNSVIVTYSSQLARLGSYSGHAHPAYGPTTRSLPNAVRNFGLARRLFADEDISRVISTGAGIAVPFILRARQLGIPCVYIESATRVDGPSLTGKILARVPGVKLYRQIGEWGRPRWQQGPCVLDGYMVETEDPKVISRVVVSFGTHDFGFPRAATGIRDILDRPGIEVLWQLGSTPDPGGLPGRVVSRLPAEGLQAEIERADVVIGHAGVGLSLTTLAAGKVPVLLPRRRRHREHTDDHQVQLARELARRGLAISAEVEELTSDHLADAATRRVSYSQPPPFHLDD